MIENKIQRLEILSEREITSIKNTSASILGEIGFKVDNEDILKILKENGFKVSSNERIVKISEEDLYRYISYANSNYVLYGRNLNKRAEFGFGKTNIQSSSGQYMYYDWEKNERREPTIKDLISSVKVASILENIDITGAFVVPGEVDSKIRDIETVVALLNNSDKPISFWINNGKTAKYIIEIMKVIRDGQGELRDYPFCECFVEAISPLQFASEGLEILEIFANEGLPIGFGPMAMQGATAPVTIAGTIAQENAEVLAGIVIAQVINPGNPVTYWGIPHCMDMSMGNMSFASPEQSLLAVSLVQVARSYGFRSVGVNLGLSDSNLMDLQSGFERGVTLLNGIYSKADILAHQGICGQDSCGFILQLICDNECLSYLKRYFNSFKVNDDTLAFELIKKVGIGGNFLVEDHTLNHFRDEVYSPKIFNRNNWDTWYKKGKKSTQDFALERFDEIGRLEPVEPIDESMMKEIRKILNAARRELVD